MDFILADTPAPHVHRLCSYDLFSSEVSSKKALLIECGLNWVPSSVALAKEIALRFLDVSGCVDFSQKDRNTWSPGKVITTTEIIIARTDRFKFVEDFRGFEVVPCGGTVIGFDGDWPIRTPYDDCVLVFPRYSTVPKGDMAVRLGRFGHFVQGAG